MPSTMEVLSGAMRRGLGKPGKGSNTRSAQGKADAMDDLGLFGVSSASRRRDARGLARKALARTDAAPRADRARGAAAPPLLPRRSARRLPPRPARLVPAVHAAVADSQCVQHRAESGERPRRTAHREQARGQVQATRAERSAVDKAELQETLFWYLWERLYLHLKVTKARRWATKAGSGFLKVGLGSRCRARAPRHAADAPVRDGAGARAARPEDGPTPSSGPTASRLTVPQSVFAGRGRGVPRREGQPVRPRVERSRGPADRRAAALAQPVPDECDVYHEGEVYVEVRSLIHVRFDRYVDDVAESLVCAGPRDPADVENLGDVPRQGRRAQGSARRGRRREGAPMGGAHDARRGARALRAGVPLRPRRTALERPSTGRSTASTSSKKRGSTRGTVTWRSSGASAGAARPRRWGARPQVGAPRGGPRARPISCSCPTSSRKATTTTSRFSATCSRCRMTSTARARTWPNA